MSIPSPVGQADVCEPLSQPQARALVAGSPTPVMVCDVTPEGFSVLALDPLLRRLITGARHPAGPIPGEIIPAEGFGALAQVMAGAVAAPEEQHRTEVPIGDEPLWFEVVVTLIGDAEHAQVLLVAADRTADHDIEQRQRRSARRFQAMVTHAPGLILLVDSAGRIIRCSPAVDRLLGVTSSDLIGRAFFELLHPDTLARAATVFNQVLGSPGEPIDIPDFRMSHGSSGPLFCEATATNLLHDDDVAAIVFNAHDVTDRRIAEERLELAATSDLLTGLANRRRLEYRLNEAFDAAAAAETWVGLALVDLDDFKLVNDAMGHDVGDSVLRVLASRFEALVTDRGFVARVGGDEFAVVLEEISDDRDLDDLALAVHATLAEPIAAVGGDVYVRASVGTTTGHPDTADPASLLRSGDLALYRAKRNGRNQTVRYTAELQLEAETRLRTITDLQRALADKRLRLAYQPIVRHDGALVGAEALLRWEHDGELLRPNRFLQLAEDSGLILPIGNWVFEQVCSDLRSLQGACPDLQWVSVNMSAGQLLDERLPDAMRRAIDGNGLAPSSLALEIDEATLREPDGRARAAVAAIDGPQIMVALSDLAADQTGLGILADVPATAFKIDRGFVQDLDVDHDGRLQALAMALMHLAAERGVSVVAEGVENQQQMQLLHALGCHLFQGYHYSEPLDLGSFITHAARA